MKIINRNNTIGTLCLFLLAAVLPVSCLKDDDAAKEKATVQVTFTTRAEGGTTVAGDALAKNERMQTLRVIVAKGDKILYNVFYEKDDFDEYDNGQRYKTVTFSELVTKDETDRTFVFYAIANEEGIADWPTQITSLEQLPEDITLSTTSDLIPQTAKQSITVDIPQEGNGIQKKTMQLEFVVAKVQLIVVNETDTEQTLSGISISKADIQAQKTGLFPPSKNTTLPEGNIDVVMNDMTLNGDESSAMFSQIAYVYENSAPTVGYIFNATWNGNNQPPVDLSTVEALPRGKELRITIHLKQNATAQFEYEVLDWTNVRVDIPDFE